MLDDSDSDNGLQNRDLTKTPFPRVPSKSRFLCQIATSARVLGPSCDPRIHPGYTEVTLSSSRFLSFAAWDEILDEVKLNEAHQASDFMGLRGTNVSAHILRPVVQRCARGKFMASRKSHLPRKMCTSLTLWGIGPILSFTSFKRHLEEGLVAGELYSSVGCASSAVSSAQGNEGKSDQGVKPCDQLQEPTLGDRSFLQALEACTSSADLAKGKSIHQHVIAGGLEADKLVSSAHLSMYARCGSLDYAQTSFNRLQRNGNPSCAALISMHAQHGDGWVAIGLFEQMRTDGSQPGKRTIVSTLKACSRLAALEQGKLLHAYILGRGFEADVFIGTTLVDMYAKCGCLDHARKVFDRLLTKNLVTWNSMISGYAQHGDIDVAMELFQQMQQAGMQPDKVTLVVILKACSSALSLDQGRLVHAEILKSGYELDVFVGTTLIDMYGKCGSLKEAQCVFDALTTKNWVTWNAMIAGYAQNGEGQATLELFHRMQQQGMQPNRVTFVSILKACSILADLSHGQLIHVEILNSGLQLDAVIASSLIDMYVKCGDLDSALRVFERLQKRNSVTWNALIAGYAQSGEGLQAVQLVQEMQQEGMQPDKVTLVSILKACSGIAARDQGKLLHSHILQTGYESDVFIGSILIDMYAGCGDLEDAHRVFDRLPTRNVVVWNALISAYSQQRGCIEGFQMFLQMYQEGVQADVVTFASIVKGCSTVAALDIGKLLHSSIMATPFASSEIISSSLVTMYGKCGSLEDACRLFDSSPLKGPQLWSAMIGAYVEQGCFEDALELFQRIQEEGIFLDKVSLVNALKACSGAAALEKGKLIHSMIVENPLECNALLSNSLIDMYAKCGNLMDAWTVFASLQTRDLVSWNTIIAGYIQSRDCHTAVQLFDNMQLEGIQPDKVTVTSMLHACSSIAALNWGKVMHAHILQEGLEVDLSLGSALVDMYAKCGSFEEASRVFGRLPTRELASWNSMIGGHAKNGDAEQAFSVFQNMQKEGVKPDKVTLLCLLSACSHAGLVDKGYSLFQSMPEDFNIRQDLEHYTCVVDLLGRAGHLLEAKDLIGKIPSKPDAAVWLSFLGACQIHGEVDLGRLAFENIFLLGPGNAAAYSLMSNIYAEAGMWEDEVELRRSMQDTGAKKQASCTWMEFANTLHCFVAEGQDPEQMQIFAGLGAMIGIPKQDPEQTQIFAGLGAMIGIPKQDQLVTGLSV